MSLLKIKRERSTNFIDGEPQLLVDLVASQKHILENKKTDAVTANLKNKTWEALANKFNCKSLNGYRGGPPIPLKALSKLSPMEEQLRSLNPLAFSGKVSAFDSDRIEDQNTYSHEMLVQDYEKTDSNVSN
ncbi:unnamed protein product [Macrosiphum euphorbiae]|uniref:Regulatory protein zeste n=1 Tax=Macrosiphum euphorbiae TaxID=13131 RepID=A0AAV0WQS4_9HEMI|nr:unnamed protein product [Macrosiphum euphorbiae]